MYWFDGLDGGLVLAKDEGKLYGILKGAEFSVAISLTQVRVAQKPSQLLFKDGFLILLGGETVIYVVIK